MSQSLVPQEVSSAVMDSGLTPSHQDIAEYVQEMTSELEKLCTGAGLRSIAACLALAASEAERLSVTR